MSVVYCEGFETSADQTDLNKKGLLTATTSGVIGCGVVPIPSRTGVAGQGLFLRGPYGSATALPCSAAGTADFGMLPLGQSIYSLWAAGGFAIGINASFNSGNTFQVAAGDVQQIAYDGSQYYWAVCYTGAAWVVAYSSDLKNWTQTAAQPTVVGASCNIMVAAGSGATATILVSNLATSSTGYQSYYSTNLGATWTAVTPPNVNYGPIIATGNVNAPYVGLSWVNTVGYKLYYWSAIGGSGTLVASSPVIVAASANFIGGVGKLSNGQILLSGSKTGAANTYPNAGNTSQMATCPASSNPTVIGNWVILAASPQQFNDVAYFNGYVIGAGINGLWYNSNTGASAWTLGSGIPSSGSFMVSGVAANGSIAVAVGTDPTITGLGAIWTSTNGTTWTKANRILFNNNAPTASAVFTSVVWDGARFVATGGLNSNIIATSPDGLSWTVVYAADLAEQTGTSSMSFMGVFSGSQNPVSGIFTPWGTAAGNVAGVGVNAAALSSNARVVTATTVTAGALSNTALTYSASCVQGALGQQPPSTLSHYYELVFTATGTPNQFNVSWAIDNAVLGVLGQFQMAATTDTTGAAQAFINLPRNGQWTQIDDIYVTNFSGAYHNNRMGVQRIYPVTPSSDVSDQFTNSISGANSAAVNTALSNSQGFVYSTAATAQDVYGTTNTAPGSGVAINAIQVEGYLSTYSTNSAGTGQVGVQSSGVKAMGSNVSTSSTPVYAKAIVELDPNTNAPWTTSGLNAVDIVVGKTS